VYRAARQAPADGTGAMFDDLGMWVTFAAIVAALSLYMWDEVPMELTSLAVICGLLGWFHFFPVRGPDGVNLLDPTALLAGFANPALITIAALLVMGQGLARTGVLEAGAGILVRAGRGHLVVATGIAFVTVLAVSGFLNNTPVVVIFIPIMQALAERFGQSPAKLMMPLSFVAILGGMTTLIGSSTNLLVSGTLIELGLPGFSFFQFIVPGLVVALVGLVFVLFAAPRLIPARDALTSAIAGSGRQFMAEIAISDGSKFAGIRPRGGFFPELKDLTVRVVLRGDVRFVPPFDDSFEMQPGDTIIVAATRAALTEALRGETGAADDQAGPDWQREAGREGGWRWRVGDEMLAELMVTPASRMAGQTLAMVGFRYKYHCTVLGIQRRSQMIRARVTDIRLEPGDVLLVQGGQGRIEAMRGDPDVLLIEWSAENLPAVHHAWPALGIFGAVIVSAATGLLPIVVAAVAGAVAMLLAKVLNIRQAGRAIDRRVVLLVAAALALGTALQATGGAGFLAGALLAALGDAAPATVLSAFVLLVALLTNVMSNNAVAVLFTPIAVEVANGLGVAAEPFAVGIVIAASCAFATPIGYQTNLLVMAPGNYRFGDFVRAGLPLIFIVWATYSLFAPWYYGL
jgi:di/tricarboxylate transporter